MFLSIPALAQESVIPRDEAQIKLSYAPLVKRTAPAVVNIYSKRRVQTRVSPFANDPFFNQFFGGQDMFGGVTREQVENTLGSGVIVDESGIVVTNSHVVKDAEEIRVVLSDGREFEAIKTLGDAPSDLAILRIDGKGEKLPFIPLSQNEDLEVGDLVLAIGNPFGVGQTVTSGIVSALARSSQTISDYNFFIQTDAAINPGNSGGPLVDMKGNIVGINTAIYSRDGGSLGIGFAIPVEMVASVIAAEKAGAKTASSGGVARAWLGMAGQQITSDIADSLGLKTPAGVLVAGLHKASPARKAGLQQGDVVLAVNGKSVHEPAEMKYRMATVPLGSEAVFDVLRKGENLSINVKAITPPEDPPRRQKNLQGAHPFNGVSVSNLNPAVVSELGMGIEDAQGVVVVAVPASSMGIRVATPGDIIVSINDKKITDTAMLESLLSGSAPGQGWKIVLSQKGQIRQVIVR